MTEFELEMVAIAKELLTEFGFPVTVKSKKSSNFDPATLKPVNANTDSQGMAVFFDPALSSLSGYEGDLDADELLKKKWMYVQCDGPVETGDHIISTLHGEYKAFMATAIGPSEAIIHKVASDKVKRP